MNDNIIISRLGQNNATGDDRALFKEKSLTDILEFFKLNTMIRNLITVKTIESGKSASFPVVGTATAEYLTPGDPLDGRKIKHTERVISIDDLLVSEAYIFDLDKAMAAYDSKAYYIKQLGEALARSWEKDAMRTLVQAASINNAAELSAAGMKPFDDQKYNETVLIATADKANGLKVYQAILAAYDIWFSQENVGEPVVILQPEQYSAILINPATTGTTFVDDENSRTGKVPMIAGMKVYRSPHLPKGVVVAGDSTKAKYAGNYTGTLGVVFSEGAVASLELMSISNELSREHRYKADLMSADMAVGFGVLNPACAVLIAETGTPVLSFYNALVGSIAVVPATISLDLSDAQTQAISIDVTMTNGSIVNMTSGFTVVSSDPAKASVSGNVVSPVAVGTSTLTVSFAGKTVTRLATVVA